jgi:hypothetical protein
VDAEQRLRAEADALAAVVVVDAERIQGRLGHTKWPKRPACKGGLAIPLQDNSVPSW